MGEQRSGEADMSGPKDFSATARAVTATICGQTEVGPVRPGNQDAIVVASAVAALSELNTTDALALRAEMVEAARHLLTTGFLRPGK